MIKVKKNGEFVINELLSRIVNLKNRLDRLMFLFIVISIFAYLNQQNFKEINVFGWLVIKEDSTYHIVITIVLTVLFSMIGSHLIEYVAKRSRIDSLLVNDNYFDCDYEVSATIIPTSFYEFMYGLFYPLKYKGSKKVKRDPLRILSSFALLASFFWGHLVCFIHLFLAFNNKWISVLFILLDIILFFFLYREFVKSLSKANGLLGGIILNKIILLLIPFIIISFIKLYNYL